MIEDIINTLQSVSFYYVSTLRTNYNQSFRLHVTLLEVPTRGIKTKIKSLTIKISATKAIACFQQL